MRKSQASLPASQPFAFVCGRQIHASDIWGCLQRVRTVHQHTRLSDRFLIYNGDSTFDSLDKRVHTCWCDQLESNPPLEFCQFPEDRIRPRKRRFSLDDR